MKRNIPNFSRIASFGTWIAVVLNSMQAKGKYGEIECLSVSKDKKTKTLLYKGNRIRVARYEGKFQYDCFLLKRKGNNKAQGMLDYIEGQLSLDFTQFNNPFYELSVFYRLIYMNLHHYPEIEI